MKLPDPKAVAKAVAITLALSGLLAACGGPYEDIRREAGEVSMVGTSTPDLIALCYNASGTTPEALKAMADEACARTGRSARFVGQNRYQCSVRAPHRAYFACIGQAEAVHATPADALKARARRRLAEEAGHLTPASPVPTAPVVSPNVAPSILPSPAFPQAPSLDSIPRPAEADKGIHIAPATPGGIYPEGGGPGFPRL
ncbi:hypothetical protein [Roseospirillum parvum]|uniref:Uncharacterized protein n=1 Tax=Roseospirillum parvum TaxID=83401 RepID=A0A1G8AVP9_9PROT|nr:hypothetical protein [Roseospirillum parvum]SDH24883.1 hypothetical protein SAMN05421742_105120 [Roseospirillum parvum]